MGLFLEKNNIASSRVKESKLLSKLLNDGNNQIVSQDCEGSFHFNCDFNNVNGLISEFETINKGLQEMGQQFSLLIGQEFQNLTLIQQIIAID